ncbi:hypothetical protein B0J18DRAFT_370853 [Chaetomium sp. MPI-SDFR-AT-0129]|nr:hypothetical protein B0J18DRAFT_370853 [Chaetomium sp. MPI-SDFR-AT-0129]
MHYSKLFMSAVFPGIQALAITPPATAQQLTAQDISTFPSLAFGNTHAPFTLPACKSFPGDPSWPTDTEWSRLNKTLQGALLQPLPPASVCYGSSPNFNADTCVFLRTQASQTSFYLDDPLSILTQWPQGNTCLLSANPTGNCTQGGFPVYVVNATTVKHVQAAVNFARNRNIRLVIKNTGHDFVGRNAGAGSLSVWTHHLKGFEFLPEYHQPGGNYSGPAAHVGSGLQGWEALQYAAQYNVTLVAGGCLTVGLYGGWMAGGGHSPLSSRFGLGVDQVLALQVVTADGRYETVDPETNGDLFFALRGGGGSTYGIVTSVIVKAHPPIYLTQASFNISLGNTTSSTPTSNPTITNPDTFWAAFQAVYAFALPTVEVGGFILTNGVPLGNSGGVQLQVIIELPGFTPSQATDFLQPLQETLTSLGIPFILPTPTTILYSAQTGSHGVVPGNIYFASRLFPRSSFTNTTTLFPAVIRAVRSIIAAGYRFHGLNMTPTLRAAGYPSVTPGVNPLWRDIIMHADVFSPVNMGTVTPAQGRAEQEKLNGYMDMLRAATPGGGAYVNEADVLEPGWQESFFGGNYARLVEIKEERDPWGVFWAPTTPGSERWKVVGAGELPTQNGRLCKA